LVEHRLLRVPRDEVDRRAKAGVVLIPVGSLEQHGDHLPVGCDSILVEAIAREAAQLAKVDILITPTLWCGVSPHHLRFGATATISADTLLNLTCELVESVRTWADRVAILNGHGGNREALAKLALELAVPMASYWDLAPEAMAQFEADSGLIGHAGQVETSLMMAISPGLVGAPGDGFEPAAAQGDLRVPDMGTSGVIGDPHEARAELGHKLARSLSTAVARWLNSLPNDTNT
jgi:creatinine amidohydrolase